MEALLYVFCMHAAPKPPEPLASLVSMNKSPFPLAIYACIGNRQFDWRVPLDWGCRARCAGDQAVQCRFRVSRANRHPYWRFAFHRNRQCGWRFALFEIFPSPSIIKEKAPESAQLRVPSIALFFFFISSPITLRSSYFVPVFCFTVHTLGKWLINNWLNSHFYA